MDLSSFHPYVYFATRYPFSRKQASRNRQCYAASLCLVSEGEGFIHTDGRTIRTAPGSLVYVPAGQRHDWIADDDNPMVHVCCYFDWAFKDRRPFFHQPSTICYDPSLLQPSLIGPVFPYPIPLHVKVEKIRVWVEWFEKFYVGNEYVNERTYLRSLTIQGQFQQFLQFYLSYVLKEEHIPDPRMNKLLERLEQDLIRGSLQPLEAYYGALGISRGYFFELFKHATGLSPVQYINAFRISRTKEDLRHSDLSITSIAEKHHFSSVHYFSKLFRQVTGATPSEFRLSKR